MTKQEILSILKEAANFELKQLNFGLHAHGSISSCPQCKNMAGLEYSSHYEKMKKKLESLPWEKVVKYPRNPHLYDEYPHEDGVYITMMDCNEHEVCTNIFRNGNFSWMNRTHIKWWMKLPED